MTRKFQLYIIPTPIGNIRDITLRAIEILKEVDFIACEDTRVTQKLLNHYDINTKCISYHKYNERERVDFLIRELENNKSIALVSDAGTPMICDPGAVLTEELAKRGIAFTSLPGACAVTTFLSQVPRKTEEFLFIGFMPRSENQITDIIKKYAGMNVVFYDSPERILKTLSIVKKCRENAQVSLGRELSKLYEEVKTGSVSEILSYFQNGIKGEIVCMVSAEENSEDTDLDYKIELLKSKGFKDKDIAVIISTLFNQNKNDVYKKVLNM